MQKAILTMMVMMGCYVSSFAQKSTELNIFAENGEKFYLILDGEKQNSTPSPKVRVPGLTNEGYKVKIIFEDVNIASIDDRVQTKGYNQAQSYEQAKQITYVIKNKGKGKYVLRSSTWSFYDGNESATTTNTNTQQPNNVQNNPVDNNTNVTKTTTTRTTTTTGGPDGNVNMNVGMNGVSVTDPDGHTINMNVNMDPNNPNMNTNVNTNVNTTHTTTTTTTRSSGYDNTNNQPNNTGPNTPTPTKSNKCVFAMNSTDFASAKASINKQSFAEEKMKVAKQIVKAKCVNTAQVKEMMGLFSFETNKLDFAKFSYDYTIDKDNYYQINDAFSFSSSTDELNTYIEGKK